MELGDLVDGDVIPPPHSATSVPIPAALAPAYADEVQASASNIIGAAPDDMETVCRGVSNASFLMLIG